MLSSTAVGDESGWRKVREICVPHVELEDDPPLDRSLPEPDGTVNLEFGLSRGLPASDHGRIKELARGLDHDPEKCYRYVRNNIAYASYHGLLKGPERTLLDREGNELDQAFLLLALLRASGFSGAGVGYSPLAYTNDVLASHFRIPLRKQESGSDYNATDWLGVDPSGTVSDIAERVRTMLALAGQWSAVVAEDGIPYIATEHFYVTLPADGGGMDYMDPAFKPSRRSAPRDVASDSGYSRSALLSAVGGTTTAYYVQNLSKNGLATFLDGLVSALRGTWTNENASVGEFIGEETVVPQPDDDLLHFHGAKVGCFRDYLAQGDSIKNYYRAKATLRIGASTLASFFLDEIGIRSLWISFQDTSATYPKAVLHLDDSVIASEPAGSSSELAPLSISISYAMGSCSHTYRLKRGVSNVYAVPVGFGADAPSSMRKITSEVLAERIAAGDSSSPRTLSCSLAVAGQQWISQVAMCLRPRSRYCGYKAYDYYNVGIAGFDGAPFLDFGNRFGYFSNLTTEMEGEAFFSSALEHAVLDQLNGLDRPSVSTVRILDAANAAGIRLYFASSNNYSTAISALTGYDYAVKTNIRERVEAGCSALLPKSGSVGVNGWIGYGYAMQDHVNCVSGMFISGSRNGGYCTVNSPPSGLEYIEKTSTVTTFDGSIVQSMSADPVLMPDGAFYDSATDLSLPGGTALNWTRHYDSRLRRHSGDLGLGWCHSFEASVSEVSDPDSFFGNGSVDAVLPTTVASFVMDDMLNGEWDACDAGAMARRWTLAAMTAQWWAERTTGASVVVTLGARSLRFSRRADGSFAPSPGVTASLARTPAGTYVLSERLGRIYAFNADGRLATITDPSGNVTTLTYSARRLIRVQNAFGARFTLSWSNGRISRVTDSAGRFVAYTYDSSGRLSVVNDVRRKLTRFAYDSETSALSAKTNSVGDVLVRNLYNEFGQVTNQLSNAGGTWKFGYGCSDLAWDEAPDGGRRTQSFDPDGRMAQDVARDGAWTLYAYDGHGHVVCQSNKFGRVESYDYGTNDLLVSSGVNVEGHGRGFAYDGQLRVSEVTNAVGGVTRFSYDDSHRITLAVLPDGSSVSNDWTAAGLLSARIEFASDGSTVRRTTWEYADAGLPVLKTVFGAGLPPSGVSESYAYDSARRMTSRTDANGHTMSFTYDAAGNLLTKTEPDGAVTTCAYDNAGRLVSLTDAMGRTTLFTWTPSGKPSSTAGPDGGITTNVYDAADRLIESTDARGATVQFNYDASGRVVRRTGPDGTTVFVYNAAGLQSAATNAIGGIEIAEYDFAYNPIVTSNTAGRAQWTAYDGLDRVISMSNSIGKVRRSVYDAVSRRTAFIRPSGAQDSFGYDALGNRTSFTNAEGRVYRMAYDALGRATSATNALGECVFAAVYDGVGNVVSRTDGLGTTSTFAYDSCDRLVSRTTANGVDSFSYDLVGNMTAATNGVAAETFVYDARNRLTSATTHVATNVFANVWHRDAGGFVTNVVYVPGKAVSRTYDLAGRLVSVSDWLGHTWTFSWNGLGQQTGGTSPDGTAHTFAYDACGNLTAWSAGGIAGRTIERDTEGRRLRDTVTAGPMPKATLRRNAENTFDAADRLVSATVAYNGSRSTVQETFLYDGNGAMTNATSGGETVFAASYDAQGRLASLGGPPSSAAAFSYDAIGNRILFGGHIFVPDHSDPLKRPLIECDADGTPLRYYIWGPGRLLGFIDAGRAGSPLPADALTVVHSDEQGSVIALTDTDGGLLYRASYSPHGEDWGSSGTNATPFAWLGGLGVMRMGGPPSSAAAFTTLYLTRHRLYSPVLRRFLSADPLGIDGGLNLYAYANGNPLDYIDPLGLCASDIDGWIRLAGFFQMIGGGAEAAIGFSFAGLTAKTGVGIAVGVAVGLHGTDVAIAGYYTMVNGVPQDTLTSQGLQAVGVPPDWANGIDAGVSVVDTIGVGAAARAGQSAMTTVGTTVAAPEPTTTMYHGGVLRGGKVSDRFYATPELEHALRYANDRVGGVVYEFKVPKRVLNQWEMEGLMQRGRDSYKGIGASAMQYEFSPSVSPTLNSYMIK